MLDTSAPFSFNIDRLQLVQLTIEQKLDHRDFLLCESCFWCASYIDHAGASRCPVCKSSRLARLPVK
jgi:predicted Zn-ribbon and HTH transcriptional regulator